MRKILAALLLVLLPALALAQNGLPGGPGAQIPNGAGGVQVNLNAAADPTANNDLTQGYQVGSIWQNSSTGRVFIARSVAAGAAVWTALEPSDHPGYIVSNWALPFGYTSTTTGSALAVNAIRCYPGFIKQRISINTLATRVVANAAGNVQLAVYRNNPSTGRPTGTALASTASMSTAAAGIVQSAAATQFEIGLYWFCANTDTAALTFTSQVAGTFGLMGQIIGSATAGNVLGSGSGSLLGISVTQTFGTWPDMTSATFSELVGNAAFAGVQFLVQSVP